jgi:hypothetical protein
MRIVYRLGFVLMVGILAATSAPTQEKFVTVPRTLPGGGISHPAGNVGYFPNTTGGIDAVDLETGKLLWASKDADQPLFATKDRLYAQVGKTNSVRVVGLDTMNDGKRVLESEAIKFPDWVSVKKGLGREFRSGAGMDEKGLWLSWDAQAFYAGGARPSPEIEKAARKSASGVARIDAKTGKIESLSDAQIKAGKFPLGGPLTTKVGALTLSVQEIAAKNAPNPFQRQRVLIATNAEKQVVWQREIWTPIFIPPPP